MQSDTALEIMRRDGFRILQIDDPSWESIASTFELARLFFRTPLEEKMANMLPDECGYRPLGREYSQSENYPDQIESYSVTRRTTLESNRCETQIGRNLRKQMIDTMAILEAIAEDVTIQLASAICGREHLPQLEGSFCRWSRLQVNHACILQDGQMFIHESHEDGDLITVACATASGLEIRTKTDKYVPMNLERSQVVLMPGEILSLLSGGLIEPLWHRVKSQSNDGERLALLFFGDIDPAVCQPWIRTDTNLNVNIAERVRNNVKRFGLVGFTSD